MSLRFFSTILFLSCPIVSLHAQELKYKPIDAETIDAYKKLGATYGGFRTIEPFVTEFVAGEDLAKKDLPGFRLILLLDEEFPKLPPVKVSFGIDLTIRKGAEYELKQLKNHDTLTVLHVRGTHVPERLKNRSDQRSELPEDKRRDLLYQPRLLHHIDAWITDEGLDELKSITNLAELNLTGNPITNVGVRKLKELKQLKSLNLTNTDVTAQEAKKLREALPGCWIIHE